MDNKELEIATQILEKHNSNLFPLMNNISINAMQEYAEWYYEKRSKLHQPLHYEFLVKEQFKKR